MEIGKNNRFYVVEFVDPPHRGFDKYICIPVSWVLMHDEARELVVTKYPVEKSSEIKQRIKDYDDSSPGWSFYVANFKNGTGSYEEAENYIKTLENRVVAERNYPELTKKCDDGNLSSIFTRMDNSQKALLKDDVKPASETASLNDSEMETHRKQARVAKFANYSTSFNKMNNKQLKQSISKPAKKPFHSTIIRKPISSSDSSNMMKVVNRTPLSVQLMAVNNPLAARYSDTIATTTKGIAGRHSDSISNVTASKGKVASEVPEEGRDNKSEKEREVANKTQDQTGVLKRKEAASDEKEYDDDNEDFSKKKQKFILPPEYNENDSKWTLKYRQLSPELIELTEGSGIYVNAAMLIKNQRSTTDSKQLARFLLLDIFSESALRTCLFTKSSNGLILRPGLDEHATTVLVDYVEQYAHDHNWPKVDRESIIASIRTKLQNMKRNRE